MRLKQFVALLTVSLATFMVAVPGKVHAAEDVLRASLQSKSFAGELRVASGLFSWIRVQDSITFEDGLFIWASGIDGGYEPVPYETEEVDGSLRITARSQRKEGDYVEWAGIYDGENLLSLTGIWNRVENDFVHNLLLPRKVNFIFRQDEE